MSRVLFCLMMVLIACSRGDPDGGCGPSCSTEPGPDGPPASEDGTGPKEGDQRPAPGPEPEPDPVLNQDLMSGDPVLELAATTLRDRAKAWYGESRHRCAVSCHTTIAFMRSHPLHDPESQKVAGDLIDIISERVRNWEDIRPFYPRQAERSMATEALLNTIALIHFDLRIDKAVSPLLCRSLDQMWARQRDDGGFPWLDFNLAPWEEDAAEAWGAAILSTDLARLANHSPDLKVCSPETLNRHLKGLEKLHGYLRESFSNQNPHHQIWTFQADRHWKDDLLEDAEKEVFLEKLQARFLNHEGSFRVKDFGEGWGSMFYSYSGDMYMSSLVLEVMESSRSSVDLEPLRRLVRNQTVESPALFDVRSLNRPGIGRNNRFFTDANIAVWLRYQLLSRQQDQASD